METGNWDFGVHGSWLDAVKQFLPSTVNLEPGTLNQDKKEASCSGDRWISSRKCVGQFLGRKNRLELSMVSLMALVMCIKKESEIR